MRGIYTLTEEEKQVFSAFERISVETAEVFAPYHDTNVVGDTSFSLLYVWQGQFHYAYRMIKGHLVVLEKGVDERLSCILLRKKEEDISDVIETLYQMFHKAGLPLYFEYVAEKDLPVYEKAVQAAGMKMQSISKEEDSDYIYETEAFLSLEGKENKRKRGDLNNLHRQYENLSVCMYDGSNAQIRRDCESIFEDWCTSHSCENCYYGCEKQACFRFFDIYNANYHKIAVAYADGIPLSFAISERINADTVCYFFQKNRQRVRGLTYYLNREMALTDTDITYINLGEDMGLPGLREDKRSLHPCEQKKKYFIMVEV